MNTKRQPDVVEATSGHSDYLTFSRNSDVFAAEAADPAMPALAFLRIEMARVRVGMADFLMKVATPKMAMAGSKGNIVVTLRCNRRQASQNGNAATAHTIIAEMKRRGDKSVDWEKVNVENLTKMLAPHLKFFTTNLNVERLIAETEAL